MSGLDYILEEMDQRERGFAAHYLFLYSVVRGLHAQWVFEFGAGLSTRVILDALKPSSGSLMSVSTDACSDVVSKYDIPSLLSGDVGWEHHQGLSVDVLPALDIPPLDLVLHDGAHDYETVRADLGAVLPHVKRGGLVLIHDSAHSHCGAAVRRAIGEVVSTRDSFSAVELPYGYGLAILRRMDGDESVRVNAFDKPFSSHHTRKV